jgi:hypothetical protein
MYTYRVLTLPLCVIIKFSTGGGLSSLGGKDSSANSSANLAGGVTTKFTLPRVLASEPSSIISADQMAKIAFWLSDSKASKAWTLSYSLRQHGDIMKFVGYYF